MLVSRERTPSLDVKLQCIAAPPTPQLELSSRRNAIRHMQRQPCYALTCLHFTISSCGPRGGCCCVIDRPIAGEVTEGILFSKVWLNILPVERLERVKDGMEVGVSGGLLEFRMCLRSGEMRVMVTYGDWECDQNKGVHVGMLLVA